MSGRILLAAVVAIALTWPTAAAADPTNGAPPVISGDSTLTLDRGTWSSTTQNDVSFTYQWQSCAYPNAVLGDGPIAYYRLSAPNDADVSGFQQPALDGQSQTAAGAIAGDSDGAYSFPYVAPQQGIIYPTARGDEFSPHEFPNGEQPITIEAWINPSGLPDTDAYVAGVGGDTAGANALNLELTNTGSAVRLAVFDGSRRYVATSGTFAVGSWYHVALTYDGSIFRLYENGALVGTFSAETSFSLDPEVARIDASVPRSMLTKSLGGSIDEVAFYASALDATTLAAHATAGASSTSDVRCNDIPGANHLSLPVTSDLAGARVRAQVEATDSDGTTAAWSNEIAVQGSYVVPQPVDLIGAQQFGPQLVGGTVVDSQGLPVVGARVSVYESLPTRTRVVAPIVGEALTDSWGVFAIYSPDLGHDLDNLIIVVGGDGVSSSTYLTRIYDSSGAWLDDSGAVASPLTLSLPTDGSTTPLAGAPTHAIVVPCPPVKTKIAGPKPGVFSVADVHTWANVKAQLTYTQGSRTTVSIAASTSQSSGFVASSSTATITGGFSLSQTYPLRGPNTNIAETTGANASEFKTIMYCWHAVYTIEPTSFIGGTLTPRTASAGLNGRCPTRITNNSTSFSPGAQFTRSNGTGYTYNGGFSINFGGFSVGLSERTDWSSKISETWYPQAGSGNKLWVCGDGTATHWQNAQRIYTGPWTS